MNSVWVEHCDMPHFDSLLLLLGGGSHLGCALKWNPVEHSWDCPCHGSRFGEDGTLIDNPANGDLEIL